MAKLVLSYITNYDIFQSINPKNSKQKLPHRLFDSFDVAQTKPKAKIRKYPNVSAYEIHGSATGRRVDILVCDDAETTQNVATPFLIPLQTHM